MTVDVKLTVSKIGRGLKLKGSGHNEIEYNSLKCKFRTKYTL